ncbi:hypothetical protein CSOJ01_09832 [Colletotrichum sojae]|uniref:Uncharacterized protein n=1 Tax=Colletotrichum sojae TaxID=2175907 RepID=A0A8H6J1S5_9PEZI|nr:hypothetical protein CSOJ01_09832 [Colletotrichum sojae]
MFNFPKLIPAFTVRVHLGTVSPLGALANGQTQVHASFLENEGGIVSEGSYPLRLDAAFRHGSDFLRFDPGGARARLEVTSVLCDKNTEAVVRFDYTGVVDVTGPAGKVLNAAPDAKTTDFGDAFTHVKLSSGHDSLKDLENKVYVGSGRFIVEQGKPVVVEYKISEVVA